MASIKERNGSYQITVSMGRDVYGKQILKYTSFTPDKGLTPRKRQKAVEAFAFDFEQRCLNGQLLEGEKITLQEFIVRWTAEKAQQELQPGTLEKYQAVIDSFILNHYNADKSEGDKLPMIPFHGLRHTKATLQIAADTDVRTVSAILGHRETSTTMNIYSHSLQTAEQEAANRIDELLKKQA